MTGRNTRTSQKAGIGEALLSLSQKPRAKSPTPAERSNPSRSPQSDFLFPVPGQVEEPHEDPHTPDAEEPHDPFLPQEDDPEPDAPGERDLAQALELLANKIAGIALRILEIQKSGQTSRPGHIRWFRPRKTRDLHFPMQHVPRSPL